MIKIIFFKIIQFIIIKLNILKSILNMIQKIFLEKYLYYIIKINLEINKYNEEYSKFCMFNMIKAFNK